MSGNPIWYCPKHKKARTQCGCSGKMFRKRRHALAASKPRRAAHRASGAMASRPASEALRPGYFGDAATCAHPRINVYQGICQLCGAEVGHE